MKLAKIESVYRPNLLVNGDFQINQRGQTSYTSNDVQSSLTVDCWRIDGQATLTVNDDNVILSATGDGESYLAQHIDKDLTGEKLSVAVKVTNDKVYTGTITVTDVETVFISDGQWMTVSAKYDSNRNGTQLYINVAGGHSYSFEYADAFEGSIVYPHVEEDDAIALMRCKYETLNLNDGDTYTICQYTNGSAAKFVVWNTFRETPLIVDYGMQYFNSNLQWVDCENPPQVVNHGNYLELNITCQNANYGSVLIRRLPLLTCEPL